jgi:hypothetical protein
VVEHTHGPQCRAFYGTVDQDPLVWIGLGCLAQRVIRALLGAGAYTRQWRSTQVICGCHCMRGLTAVIEGDFVAVPFLAADGKIRVSDGTRDVSPFIGKRRALLCARPPPLSADCARTRSAPEGVTALLDLIQKMDTEHVDRAAAAAIEGAELAKAAAQVARARACAAAAEDRRRRRDAASQADRRAVQLQTKVSEQAELIATLRFEAAERALRAEFLEHLAADAVAAGSSTATDSKKRACQLARPRILRPGFGLSWFTARLTTRRGLTHSGSTLPPPPPRLPARTSRHSRS